MATARPFAYNTGSAIPGTEQVGNLAVGIPTNGFASTGIAEWWNGPDEELGYVIACQVPSDTQPTPVELFWDPGYVGAGNTLSLANTRVTNSGVNTSVIANRLFGPAEKVMFSIKINQTTNGEIGAGQHGMNLGSYVGSGDAKSVGFSSDGKYYYYGGDQGVPGLPTWGAVNDIVDIAVNMAGYIYIRVNGGSWNGSILDENPASGSGSIGMGGLTNLYPAMTPYQGIATILETPAYSVPAGFTFLGRTLASVGFFRSSDLTDGSFIEIANYVAGPSGGGPFSSGDDAKTWLNANGYWTSYTSSLMMDWNIQNTSSYSGSGSTITDLSGNGVNGAITGTIDYSGGSPKYITIQGGVGEYIYTSNLNPYLSPANTGTTQSIFLWIYPTSNGIIYSEQGNVSPDGGWYDAQIQRNSSGNFLFGVWPYTINSALITSPLTYALNNWYYVGWTYDGTALKGYVNGSQVGSFTMSRQTPYNNGGSLPMYFNFGFPTSTDLSTTTSAGTYRLGSVQVYNAGFTSAQVLANYNATKTVYGL